MQVQGAHMISPVALRKSWRCERCSEELGQVTEDGELLICQRNVSLCSVDGDTVIVVCRRPQCRHVNVWRAVSQRVKTPSPESLGK